MHDYNRKDMIVALATAGIAPGDTVLFYVSLGFLGRPEGVAGQEELNYLFLDCCREALGAEGTLLVPAYSYSFCRGEDFDLRATQTTLGPFPEFFRTVPGVERSVEPILSVCGSGPAADALFRDLPPTSYGVGSLYARLVEAKAKICTVGLQMHWATFRHHIEEIEGVPFRYRKYFSGDLVDAKGGRTHALWKYSVRLWSKQAEPDGRRLAHMMAEDGVSRSAPLGRGRIFCVRADDYYAYAADKFKVEPWLSAAGPQVDPFSVEKMRAPQVNIFSGVPTPERLEDVLPLLTGKQLHPVSDSYETALRSLAAFAPMTLQRYKTGEEFFGLLVPERWECKSVELATASGAALGCTAGVFAVMGSRSFEGNVSRSELQRHLYMQGPGAEVQLGDLNLLGTDWGLGCSTEGAEALFETDYHVSLNANFSFGETQVAECLACGSESESVVLVYARLANNGVDPDAPLAAIVCAELMRQLQVAPKGNTCLLIVPDEVALLVWLGHNPGVRLRAAIELRNPSSGEEGLQAHGFFDTYLQGRLASAGLAHLFAASHDSGNSERLVVPYYSFRMVHGVASFNSAATAIQILQALCTHLDVG